MMSSLFLKPKVPAFTVPQPPDAMDVILERAKELMVIIVPNPISYYELPLEKNRIVRLSLVNDFFVSFLRKAIIEFL